MNKRPRIGEHPLGENRERGPVTRSRADREDIQLPPRTDPTLIERGASKVRNLTATLASLNPFSSSSPRTQSGAESIESRAAPASNPFYQTYGRVGPAQFPDDRFQNRAQQRNKRLGQAGQESREYLGNPPSTNPYYQSTSTPRQIDFGAGVATPAQPSEPNPFYSTPVVPKSERITERFEDLPGQQEAIGTPLVRIPENQPLSSPGWRSLTPRESADYDKWYNSEFRHSPTADKWREEHRQLVDLEKQHRAERHLSTRPSFQWKAPDSTVIDSYRKIGFVFGKNSAPPSFTPSLSNPIQPLPELRIPSSVPSSSTPVTTSSASIVTQFDPFFTGTMSTTFGATTTTGSGTTTTATTSSGTSTTTTTTTGTTTSTGTAGGGSGSGGSSATGSTGSTGTSVPGPPIVNVAPSSIYVHGLSYDGSSSPQEFIEAFQNMVRINNWTPARTVYNLLLHLKDAAYNCYRNNIQAVMRANGFTTEDELYASPFAPTCDQILAWLRMDFSNQETHEVLTRRIENIRYRDYPTAAQYYNNKLALLIRMDPAMPEKRRVAYLIKGLPKNLAQSLYLNNPQTAHDVLDLLGQFERFNSLYGGSETNHLEEEIKKMSESMTRMMAQHRQEVNNLIAGKVMSNAEAEAEPKKDGNKPQNQNQPKTNPDNGGGNRGRGRRRRGGQQNWQQNWNYNQQGPPRYYQGPPQGNPPSMQYQQQGNGYWPANGGFAQHPPSSEQQIRQGPPALQAPPTRGSNNDQNRSRPDGNGERQPRIPLADRQCYSCGVYGHIARRCPMKADQEEGNPPQGN